MKFGTWGAFLGADLLAIFKVAGLGGPRAKMPYPLTPIIWDRLGDVLWFAVEDKTEECKITQVYLHQFETVLGPSGASRLEARYANKSNFLHNKLSTLGKCFPKKKRKIATSLW